MEAGARSIRSRPAAAKFPVTSRYIQYRAQLSTSDRGQHADPERGLDHLFDPTRHHDQLRSLGPHERLHPDLRVLRERAGGRLRMPLRLGCVRALQRSRCEQHPNRASRRRLPHLRSPRHDEAGVDPTPAPAPSPSTPSPRRPRSAPVPRGRPTAARRASNSPLSPAPRCSAASTVPPSAPAPRRSPTARCPTAPTASKCAATDQAGNVDPTPPPAPSPSTRRRRRRRSAPVPRGRPTAARRASNSPPSPAPRCSAASTAPPSAPAPRRRPTASLADGPHSFEVRATDQAGNVDPTPAARSFTVDTQPPDTTISSGPSGLTNDSTPTFEFSSSPGLARMPPRLARLRACTSPEGLCLHLRRRPPQLRSAGDRPGRQRRPDPRRRAPSRSTPRPPRRRSAPVPPGRPTPPRRVSNSPRSPPPRCNAASTAPPSAPVPRRRPMPPSPTAPTRSKCGRPTRRATSTRPPRPVPSRSTPKRRPPQPDNHHARLAGQQQLAQGQRQRGGRLDGPDLLDLRLQRYAARDRYRRRTGQPGDHGLGARQFDDHPARHRDRRRDEPIDLLGRHRLRRGLDRARHHDQLRSLGADQRHLGELRILLGSGRLTPVQARRRRLQRLYLAENLQFARKRPPHIRSAQSGPGRQRRPDPRCALLHGRHAGAGRPQPDRHLARLAGEQQLAQGQGSARGRLDGPDLLDLRLQGNTAGDGQRRRTGEPGLTVSVPNNSTTTLRATTTDSATNVSACSAGFAYIEDSTRRTRRSAPVPRGRPATPPRPRILLKPVKLDVRMPLRRGRVRALQRPRGDPHPHHRSGRWHSHLAVRAIDQAGNADPHRPPARSR